MVDGNWQQSDVAATNDKGEFIRKDSQFRDWVKADGSSDYLPEKGRYHLYLSYACPWACRCLIFLKLKGLEEVISFSVVEPLMLENGWTFGKGKTADPLYGLDYLYQIYKRALNRYSGKVTVPILWDKKKQAIVNNESSEIIRMFNHEFNEFALNNNDFYPEELRDDINRINDMVYKNINNGVYKTGFASSQQAYEQAFFSLFSALDSLETLLAKQRYLCGQCLTEADWRLFTTLIRFDVVYYGHFKCNLRHISDYPNLYQYMLELYQYPGVQPTVDFNHIKTHYYGSHKSLNPRGIIPQGPQINYSLPHLRHLIGE